MATVCFPVSWPFATPLVHAADGSGINVVSPTSASAGSTGNTLTFTFTAAESMNNGGIAVTVPSGWSSPQGTAGIAGYTTAISSTGTVGTVLDNADSASGWSVGTACADGLGITVDTVEKKEGTGSLRCGNQAQSDGNRWYKNISSQDWSGYTKVAFWIRANTAITASQLQFAYDNDANLATPIEQINLSQALSSTTWTYIVINLGATTRTSVTSFGFIIRHATALDNNTVRVDDILAGPGLPTFPGGGVMSARLLQLSNTQTVTITYGSGGGSGGVTAPVTIGPYTFMTQSRISDSGTLTNIATSPVVTVNDSPPTPTPTPSSSTPRLGNITVTKKVINDNGGTKILADFQLFVNGELVTSGETNTFPAPAPVYTVTETSDSNYTRTFSGDCDINGQLNLNGGDNRSCIITNDDIATPAIPFEFSNIDYNDDKKIDISDWSIFLSNWSSSDQAVRARDDLNKDGKLDVSDFSVFLVSFQLGSKL